MAEGIHCRVAVTFICFSVILICNAQVLTPPTFNLAKGRHITASATCGVGAVGPELYCRLTGVTGDEGDASSREIIQGQLCDYCDVVDPDRNHSAEFAIDGTRERWWQSPPLSRGNEFNKVDLVIDLEQEFHIAYIIIKMANSPRPGVWALEKSSDYGETWEPWQYFADTPHDCEKHFSTKYNTIPSRDDEVLCVTDFSKIVPLNDGEIFVSLVNGRPSMRNFSYADDLKEFMKATNVRLRLLRAKTLLGHLIGVANQDSSVTRRYFYSIKDISLGGRCVCNGHAENCNYADPYRPNNLICECQHNTVGDQCQRCDAANGFVQKKWQPARANVAFECEPCQCYGRAFACEYDPMVDEQHLSVDIYGFYNGGGVCQNCGYNSTGVNCEKCLPGFYRPYGVPPTVLDMCMMCSCDPHYHIDECEEETGRCLCREEYTGYDCDSCAVGYYGYPNCIPCDCDIYGTEGDICHVNGGQCPCKPNFVGKKCDMCQTGYFNFPECGECVCDPTGSVDDYCNVDSGQCNCHMNFGSRNCTQCADGFYDYPNCTLCECDIQGTVDDICDKTGGECLCKETFSGDRCDMCARGYYSYPDCMACQCMEPGSTSNTCEDRTGQCQCLTNFAGLNCERCTASFYKYPNCTSCDCDSYGSYGETCDQETGQCDCRHNFQSLMCDKCKTGLYNYPHCEECNCNPAGAREVPGHPLGGCGEVTRGMLCECKERVTGRICDMCLPGYWNLNRNNPLGCEECSCSEAGTIAGMNMCNMITGQCMCKVDVTGRNCDRCKDGFYGLHKQNFYGCVECNCDIGGSLSLVCDKETGQCPCKPRVQGKTCNEPIQQHFIPTLDQLKFELEDGYTPERTAIRYGYDERLFPSFSWRGYAILMNNQPEVRYDVEINKPSLYRLVYRFVNLNEKFVKGEVSFTPELHDDFQQQSDVMFGASNDPAFASVGNTGGLSTFVLNPGRWTVAIKTDESVFLDYMFLIPQAYYEATVLQNQVYRACTVPDDVGPCIHYSYPNVVDFPRVLGDSGYVIDVDGTKVPVELFVDQEILDELNIDSMAILDPSQKSFNMDLYIPKDDRYVLILNYYSNSNVTQNILFDIGDEQATAVLYNCKYSSLCRQVLLGLDEMEGIFDLDKGYVNLKVTGDDDINASIESIIAIPYSTWAIGYIRPSIVCIRINGVCVGSRYALPVGSVRIDFETLPNDHLIATELPPDFPEDADIGLVRLNETLDMIVLLGAARGPGPHKFLVHYYLPFDTGYEMPITLFANGQEFTGTFRPGYCPGLQGCRGLIYFDETGQTGNINLIDPNVKIVFNNTNGQQIWLDYLLLIPSGQYSPSDIILQPVDNSKNFIDTCLDDGFKIITPLTTFCEQNLFTLTTEFNNGALECECDIDGSLSFNCDKLGGQCQCRANVIGRKCAACRVGYYGFPRCQPCNCPFGLCHQLTGACICPPRVTGDRCDMCLPGTYGYDALIGCQECQCNPQGVVDGVMNCDENTGQCSCLPGIGGRKCDYCLAGFYAFPQCRECDCDRYGTVSDICDPNTSACLCKENVVGPRCDQCEAFTFDLDVENTAGCSNCFCFGNSGNCRESSLKWDLLMYMKDWGITNTVDGEVREAGNIIAVLEAEGRIDNTNKTMYWTAPPAYLGNKLRSYGGYLHYSVLFVLPRNESVETEAQYGPDVVLVGPNNVTVNYFSAEQPFNSVVSPMEVRLKEKNFVYANNGLSVDREDFMSIMVDLQALHIRAAYYSVVHEVRLMEVELDVASAFGIGELATSVEECACPRGYKGMSCEDCADGYYRGRNYPYRGVCIPCACNGHADTCDLYTGDCMACANNTMGEHCDTCLPGYYGDPATGPCYICGCPLPIDSNNFADSCSVVSDGRVVSCDCDEGYTGDRCERCASGYYGDPMSEGDVCRRCECSGNIDMRNPESCDFQTGDCLICINNSTGPQCNRCVDWWYGDAVNAKDCYPCSCDACGSVSCNSQEGQCTCKPNVMGIDCDSCAPDTYGFNSCNGCTACECAEAAMYTQCDANNGSCSCQPGATGHHCESCISGFWNYQPTGCELCECEYDGAVTCDPLDGSCQCLPGVTGDRCDTCLDRWVLIPQEGCEECDSCIDNLLDDLEYLDMNITYMQTGLQTVSIGVEAMKRLDAVNQSVYDSWPVVTSVLYESENITLEPLEKEFSKVDVIANNVLGRTMGSISNADVVMNGSKALVVSGMEAVNFGEMSEKEASNAIMYIVEILRQINEGIKVTNIETYITMSEQIIADIKMMNFTMYNESAADELVEAETLLETIKEKQMGPLAQVNYHQSIGDDLIDVGRRLYDLQNNSQMSEATSISAMNMIERLRDVTIVSINGHMEEIVMGEKLTQDTISMSQEQLEISHSNFNQSLQEIRNLERVSSEMKQAEAIMKQFNDIFVDLNISNTFVQDSFNHAMMLEQQAELLENMYTGTRDISSTAVAAGRAYENIVKAIDDAQMAAEMAVEAALSANMKSNGVGEESQNFTSSSEYLLMDALMRYNTTQIDLFGRLSDAKTGTDMIETMNKDVRNTKNQIDTRMDALPIGDVSDKANMVTSDGEKSVMGVEGVKSRVKDILDDLPNQLKKTVPLTNDAISTNRDINLARTQVNNVQKVIPNIQDLLTKVADQSEKVQVLGRQVTGSISELKEKIAIARNQANLIRVGLDFKGNTTVTLRNPPNVAQAGSYSKMSLFFKTTSENGLLLYAGREQFGATRANQDYMSLEVKNGNVLFKYNLGSGLAVLNHPHYVADGQWYKVTANRIGKAGTLALERDPALGIALDPVSGRARGLSTVLDMHPLTTKFYTGGLPTGSSVPSEVSRDNYVGVMESLEFDDVPMGLWNFEQAENNFAGARERNILTSVVSNGFRFDGSGYVILSKLTTGWNPSVKSQVSMKFKTYAETGLMFFAGDGKRDFLSIEIRSGMIMYQWDLGGGRASLVCPSVVNDGEWHTVQINRLNKTGALFVDDESCGKTDSPGSMTQLSITDDIAVGGYHDIILPASEVTKQGFDGCIINVALQIGFWDLNENKQSKGVIPGCPERIARVATFSSDKLSYVAKPSESIGTTFDMTFKMKTKQKEALLLYAGNTDDDTIGFSVSMVDGVIILVSDPGGETEVMRSRINTYNDGRWHYISIMKMGLKLMMNIDDRELVNANDLVTKKSLNTNTNLYFGNTDLAIPSNLTMSRKPLEGCIGDVTINGDFLNFASLVSRMRPGVSLSGCPIPEPEGFYEKEVLPTQEPLFEFTTTASTVPPTLPPGKCALEAPMPEAVGKDDLKGLYFGAYPNSRIEYKTLPSSLRMRSKLKMDFRTTANNGVMFYFSNSKHTDHISLSLNQGKIRYSFDSGTGSGVIISPETYNDGNWHTLRVGRSMVEGTLEVDGVDLGMVRSNGRARSINGRAPYFFGGLNGAQLPSKGLKNLDFVTDSFQGCLANIQLNNKDIGEPLVQNGTLPCSDLTEAGAYFYGDGGYIKLVDSFSVGQDLTIEIELRPRSLDGVIFSVHGSKGDFVVLQLVEGQLWFTADNGAGSIIAMFLPEMNNKLCDGMWHKIVATKTKNVVELTVDDYEPIVAVSKGSATSADTSNPIYLGGKPDSVTKGVRAKGNYQGCMRHLAINGQLEYLSKGVAFSSVSLGMCPVN